MAGPMWQFKGWPGLTGDGSPVEIFTRSEQLCSNIRLPHQLLLFTSTLIDTSCPLLSGVTFSLGNFMVDTYTHTHTHTHHAQLRLFM